jgi:hypothetical protein
MASKLGQYVSTATECTPLLPLTHTCDGFAFRSIAAGCQISTAHCPVFGEMLAYFFYGRPAYRPSSWRAESQSSANAFLPCSILLRADAVSTPRRVSAFDTGAWEQGIYAQFLHPKMTKDDFMLDPSLSMAARLVAKFYGSNENYYSGDPISLEIPPLEFEVQSYYKIISQNGTSQLDDRGSSVEVQSQASLSLSNASIIHVVLPRAFLDDPNILETVVTRWGVFSPGSYGIHRGDPREYMGKVYEEVEKFLRENRYFQT